MAQEQDKCNKYSYCKRERMEDTNSDWSIAILKSHWVNIASYPSFGLGECPLIRTDPYEWFLGAVL